MKEGNTADVRFSGPFENGVEGTNYVATILLYNGTTYSYLEPKEMATCLFTLAASTGIQSVSGASFGEAKIYNVNGTRIQATDLNSLPHGTYIVKTKDKSFKFSK